MTTGCCWSGSINASVAWPIWPTVGRPHARLDPTKRSTSDEGTTQQSHDPWIVLIELLCCRNRAGRTQWPWIRMLWQTQGPSVAVHACVPLSYPPVIRSTWKIRRGSWAARSCHHTATPSTQTGAGEGQHTSYNMMSSSSGTPCASPGQQAGCSSSATAAASQRLSHGLAWWNRAR